MLEQNEAGRQAKNETMEALKQELAEARQQGTHLATVETALAECKAALATKTMQHEAQADKHTDALLSAREELEGRVRELVGQTEAQKEQMAVLEDNLHSAQERYDVCARLKLLCMVSSVPVRVRVLMAVTLAERPRAQHQHCW